jgi:protein-tyrosine sulfotransferase
VNFGRKVLAATGLFANPTTAKERRLIEIHEIRNLPVIFVGGYGRSGTTLMRAILDVHPAISCGPETKVLNTFLGYLTKYIGNRGVQKDLAEAGVEIRTIGEAASSFMYYILKYRNANNISVVPGEYSNNQRLCAKDPDILHYMKYLHQIFPNAKFVHMIRDGRAAAHSFMIRVKEQMNFRKFLSYYNSWSTYNKLIDTECAEMGSSYCITIRYEDLVTNAPLVLRRVVRFLNETWTDELLQHEKYFGSQIKVSKLEWSTLQIKNKIYNNSLIPIWINAIPDYNGNAIDKTILKKYGYNLTLGMDKVNRTGTTALENRAIVSSLDPRGLNMLNERRIGLDRFDKAGSFARARFNEQFSKYEQYKQKPFL